MIEVGADNDANFFLGKPTLILILITMLSRSGLAGVAPGAKNNKFTSERQSIGRRIVRTLARFFIAVLIGVGVTLAWQSHGDEAKEMVRTWAPSLAWLLPVSATKSPPDDQGAAERLLIWCSSLSP